MRTSPNGNEKVVENPTLDWNRDAYIVGDSLSVGITHGQNVAKNAVEWGKQTGWMLDAVQKDIATLKSKKVIFILGGTNDIFSNKNADQIIANIDKIAEIGRQNGLRVIVGTIPPFTPEKKDPTRMLKTLNTTAEERFSQIDRANDYIRSKYEYIDYYAMLSDSGKRGISPRFEAKNGDGIHPFNAYGEMRQAQIDKMKNSSVSVSVPATSTPEYVQDRENLKNSVIEKKEAVHLDAKKYIDDLKKELQNTSDPDQKIRIQRAISGIEHFDAVKMGYGISDENLRQEIAKILEWKTINSYKNSDILALSKKGVDIAAMTLVQKNSGIAISGSSIAEGSEFLVNFWENKYLARRTGAGDILPATVREVEINGVKWVRGNNPRPGYYTDSGKYLPIFDGYSIKILKMGQFTPDDVAGIEKRFSSVSNLDEDKVTKTRSNRLTTIPLNMAELPKWDKWLLDFIAKAEGTNDNYDAIFGNGNQSSVKYTEMTLREVIAHQKAHANKTGSSAFGRYQFMSYTLEDLMKKHNLSPNEKFSPELQDRLAISLLEDKWLNEFKSGKKSLASFQVGVSQIWASVAKDSSGMSYYHGDKMNNHASAAGKQVRDVLETLYA